MPISTVTGEQVGPAHLADDIEDEPSQVIGRQPVTHVRRHKERWS
jgi:hypothetical protein